MAHRPYPWRTYSHVLAACTLLAGCDPVAAPVDLYHNLEGGEIAAERPPPPGAGQPYPHIGTVPDKPELPTAGFRTALYNQLAAERDQKELMAADMPVDKVPPPPAASALPGQAAGPGQGASSGATAAATPGSTAPGEAASGAGGYQDPGNPAGTAANAGTDSSNATIAAADAPAKPAAPIPPAPPPTDAGLQIAGDLASTANLPLVPDAPPPPAAIEGDVPAQPAPTAHLRPVPLPLPAGKPIYFASGSDIVAASQRETLGDVIGRRGRKGVIEIIGLGDADSDTPLGQEAAIDLGLRRARAIAATLVTMNVPPSAIRLAARPYGRGALVHVLP